METIWMKSVSYTHLDMYKRQVYDKRTMFLSIALQLCTVITYSSYLFQKGYNVTIMSIINFAIYLIYVWYYIVRLKKESIKDC